MAGASLRPPATPRGRYWHVKAYCRALKMLGAGLFVSFWIYFYWHRHAMLEVIRGNDRLIHLIIRHSDPEALAKVGETYPLLAQTYNQPIYETFHVLLGRMLTYEPVLGAIVGLLCCTVLLELRERRRQGT
ncbi:hypothetical protein [Halomicrobium salinisoli]|uniref:hypothetical protein n=1 Tax=Halomicrobium salinisoli TaxID=2878391 RepID=UPI001CF043B7|nr:hypothetical protein [Halomicrobium salinisoli]